MSIKEDKIISPIKKMISHGEFQKAIDTILNLEKQKTLRKETLLWLRIYKTRLLISHTWSESLEIIDEIIDEIKTIENPVLLIEAYLSKIIIFITIQKQNEALPLLDDMEKLIEEKFTKESIELQNYLAQIFFQKGACFNYTGELDKASKLLKKSETLSKKLKDNDLLYNIYDQLGTNSFFRANYDEAIKYFKKLLKIGKEANNNYQIFGAYNSLAQAYQRIGKFEHSTKYIEQSMSVGKELGQNLSGPKYILALNYYSMGEIKKAHELFREVLPFYEGIPNPRAKSLALWMKSSIEWYSGSIEKTIDYLTEAVEILKELNDKYLGTLLAIYLASAINDKGEYDKALDLGIENFKIFKDYNNTWFNSYYYDLLGKIYHAKGNYDLALENAKMSFKLRRELNSVRGMVQSLFYLISISIDKKDALLYNRFLEELSELVEANPNPFHDHIHRISEALVLKTSNRPRDWMKAVEILEQVIDEEYEDKKYAIIALNNLCELLMIEFSISGDEYVLSELEDYIDRLDNIAKYQNNYALKLEATNVQILALWLKAQFSLVDLDIQKAKNLLQETRKLASDEGLYQLVEKMSQQQEKVLGQVSKWDNYIRKYYEFISE